MLPGPTPLRDVNWPAVVAGVSLGSAGCIMVGESFQRYGLNRAAPAAP
jgi:hypothetical protein